MASQSLYRKWRSQTFNDLVGQEEIIRTLKNELSNGKLAHAYLFTGPRGTGKTSTARLLAKTINCPNARDGEPCNVCEQCREITAGSSFNVLEIDAASNRGIDSIRELREKVMVPPTNGRYKVYILDEAHMLTTEAFNALLKTLEEPPPHAIFVMATTDVHKMLPTVLSRCQRFDFRRITSRQIIEHLHFVAEQEHVELEKGSAELIARAAAGGMRDALSLLDQAIAYSGNTISLAQVQTMLGVADPRAMQNYISAIAELDTPRGLHLVNELSEAGADLRQVNIQLAEYWRAMMLAKAGARIVDILDNTEDELREIVHMSKSFSLQEITECARIFAQNDLMQKSQATPQLGLELALLSCINLHRQAQDGQNTTLPATTTPVPNASTTPPASVPARPNPNPPAQIERPQRPNAQPSSQAPFSPPSDSLLPPPAAMKEVFPEVEPLEDHQTPAAQAPQPVHVELHAVIATPQSTPTVSEPDSLETAEQNTDSALPDWDDLSYSDDEEALDDSRSEIIEPVELVESVERATPLSSVTVSTHVETPSLPVTVDVHIETEPAAPVLTAEDVREKWEYILRRVKTKKDGPLIQAVLRGYTVVGVQYDNNALPITYIRATAPFHYDALRRKDTYLETIRWALKVELGVESRIHLLSPTAEPPRSMLEQPTKPSTPVAETGMRGTIIDEQPPRSAQSLPPHSQSRTLTAKGQTTPSPEESQPSQTVKKSASPPLARNPQVRENKNEMPLHNSPSVQTGTRQQTLEQHARDHPVVQEVIRMFKAAPRDVRPK